MRFKDRVLSTNPSLVSVPRGYKRYGHVMILRSSDRLVQELGETILSLYTWCKSVYQHENTTGESRVPYLRLLAGDDQPEVIHVENGVEYHIDLSIITFSGGNRYLRERMVEEVPPGNFLLDMFAAVGNLSLQPVAKNNLDALLIERNRYTYSYLRSTLLKNEITPDIAINMDCRDLRDEEIADHIFLGYHDLDQSHLEVAIQAAKSKAILHLHPLAKSGEFHSTVSHYQSIVKNLGASVTDIQVLPIKDFSPGLEHIEIIFQIHK